MLALVLVIPRLNFVSRSCHVSVDVSNISAEVEELPKNRYTSLLYQIIVALFRGSLTSAVCRKLPVDQLIILD